MPEQSPDRPWFARFRSEWLPLLVLFVLIVAVASPFWQVPLSRDQGVYATCANSQLDGGVPFRDCWDTKGPALHYTYAAARLIFGHTTAGPYILNTIFIALTALLIAGLGKRWMGVNWAGYSGGMLYGVLAVAVRFDMNAQPESFANLFVMLGLLGITLAAERGRGWLYPASGAALAVAVLYKYALVLPFGVAALAIILFAPLARGGRRGRLRGFGLTLAGSLAVVCLFALYLLVNGALDDAITHIRFIFFYFPKAQLNPEEYAQRSRPLQQTLAYFIRLPVVILLAFAGGVLAAVRRRWYGIPLLLYMLAGIVAVWLQQRFTPYHWTALLPALALGVGALYAWIEDVNITRIPRYGLSAGLGVLLAINAGVFFYVDQWQVLGARLTGQETETAFLERVGAEDHTGIGEYIAQRTAVDDPIWVWGHHTPIYYLSDRRSPTRFIYNEPLLMHIRGGHPWKEQWQVEALEAIYHDPPVYLVMTLFDRTFFDFQNPVDSWYEIPEYAQFLDRYYLMEFPYGRFQVWRLKPYWSRQNDPLLLDAVTLFDLVTLFDRAEVEQQGEPPVEVTTFEVLPEPPYDTIMMQPDAALTYNLTLPDGPACLRFDMAMHPESLGWGGDGATYIVEITGEDGQTQRLFETHLANRPEDSYWHAQLLDLSAYQGQAVRLTLRTGPGTAGDYTGDWAGWALPRIVRPPAGDVCDTNAIVDLR